MTFNGNLFTISLVRSGQLVKNVSRGTQAQRDTYTCYTQRQHFVLQTNFISKSEVLIVVLMEIRIFLGVTP